MALLFLSGCFSDKSKEPASVRVELTAEQLQAKGQTLFQMQCIACHNADPRKPGTVGPAIWGSSRELLAAKVLRGEYPAGYTPQRNTMVMPKLPFLEKEIEGLFTFLNKP